MDSPIGITDAARNKLSGLRQELVEFAESGEFTKSVLWEEGDVILWDNRYLLHKRSLRVAVRRRLGASREGKGHDDVPNQYNDGYALSA